MSAQFVSRARRPRRVLVLGGSNRLGMIPDEGFDRPIIEYAPEASDTPDPAVDTVGPVPPVVQSAAAVVPLPIVLPPPVATAAPVTTAAPVALASAPGFIDTAKAWVMDHKLIALLLALGVLYMGRKVLGVK